MSPLSDMCTFMYLGLYMNLVKGHQEVCFDTTFVLWYVWSKGDEKMAEMRKQRRGRGYVQVFGAP